MTPARTLVIAEAFGYNVEVYRVFLLSLRQSGYRGDVSLLAPPNRTRPDAAALLRRHGVSLVVERRSPARHNADRFETYAQLCSVRSPYRYCLAADFRDVFFQADPFASVPRPLPGLMLTMEELTIGNCTHNSAWIRRGWGPEVLQRIGHRPALCSGTVMGTPDGLVHLARRIVKMKPFADMSHNVSEPRRRVLYGGWLDGNRLRRVLDSGRRAGGHLDGARLGGGQLVDGWLGG